MEHSSIELQFISTIARKFEQYSDPYLTGILLAAAFVIIVIALFIHNPYVKAFVAAYVHLP